VGGSVDRAQDARTIGEVVAQRRHIDPRGARRLTEAGVCAIGLNEAVRQSRHQRCAARCATPARLHSPWPASRSSCSGEGTGGSTRCSTVPPSGRGVSRGRVRDSCLACPLHGWELDVDGRVAPVPFNPTARRERLAAVSLPVVERGGLVWLYAAPRGAVDPTSIGEPSCAASQRFRHSRASSGARPRGTAVAPLRPRSAPPCLRGIPAPRRTRRSSTSPTPPRHR